MVNFPRRRHRKIASVWLLTLLVGLIPSLVQAQSDAANDERFQALNAKLHAGDAAGAIEGYNELIEQVPDAVNVLINRAVAKWRLKDQSGARADLAQAINLQPDYPESYRIRAGLRFEIQDFAGALADFEKIADLQPDYPDLRLMLGEVKIALGEWSDALSDFDHVLQERPQLTAARYFRAQALEELGRPDDALEELDRVIEEAPGFADTYSRRAWLRFYRLAWAGAIEDGKKASEADPDNLLAVRVQGYAQFGQGDYAGSAATLLKAAELANGHAESMAFALYIRHLALMRLRAPDDRLAKEVASWNEEPWLEAIGGFLTGAINEEQLESLIEEAVDEDEERGRACEANFYIGVVRLQAGDRSTARLRFQAAVATGKTTFIEHALAQGELLNLKR